MTGKLGRNPATSSMARPGGRSAQRLCF